MEYNYWKILSVVTGYYCQQYLIQFVTRTWLLIAFFNLQRK